MTEETEDKSVWESELSCTFCGPGTWAGWDVMTEDGVVFVCDRHHVEMSEKKLIRLEKRMGEKSWKKIKNYDDFKDVIDYE